MLVKIDLEKAFDKLEWSFIYRTLLYFKFPTKISRLIMSCITISTIAVLVNGSKTNYFCPSRGIRQGDPMSLYLFILYTEMLSRYINHEVEIREWDTIKLSSKGPPLSYLFFADDLVLMGKATNKTCSTIRKGLDFLCEITG